MPESDNRANRGTLFYSHQIPPFDIEHNKELKCGRYKVNLYALTCTCKEYFVNNELHISRRDLRRVCKHIYEQLKNEKISFDKLTWLLLEDQLEHGDQLLIKKKVGKNEIVIGFEDLIRMENINVYVRMPKKKEVDVFSGEHKRFKYDLNNKCWENNQKPPQTYELETVVKMTANSLRQ